MSAFLKIEIHAGTSIDGASSTAQRVANLLGISVEFDFNAVRCVAVPRGDDILLARRQQFEQGRKLDGPLDSRFASSNPKIPRRAQRAEAGR